MTEVKIIGKEKSELNLVNLIQQIKINYIQNFLGKKYLIENMMKF
jgi:hypothetical protein